MKIILIVPNFPKLSETFIVTKFIGLREQGQDIHIVTNHLAHDVWERFPALQSKPELKQYVHRNWPTQSLWLVAVLWLWLLVLTFIVQPKLTLIYFSKGWKLFGVGILKKFYLDAQLIKLKPDIIHFEFGALATERMYLRDVLNCKIVVSFRGYDINYSGIDRADFYAQVWAKADMIHCLGSALWERAIQRGCPKEKPHRLIPPAIAHEFPQMRVSTLNHDVLKIVSVGRLEWVKGYEFALEAIKIALDNGIKLQYSIIGDGAFAEAIVTCCQQLQLENDVRFLGALPQTAVLAELTKADLFLHAAVSEGFCNAVIEAQALGLPVIASDAGGLVENVEDQVTGLIVPRRNPQAMAEKIILLANDAWLRQQMGKAGHQRVVSKFTLSTQIERFTQLYDELAGEQKPNASSN